MGCGVGGRQDSRLTLEVEGEYHVYSKYRCMWQCVVTRQAELSDRTWCSNAVTLDLPLGIGLSEGLTGLKI